MLLSTGVPVFLCKSEIDDVNLVGALSQTNKKVVRLYVSVEEILRVKELHTRYCLIGDHENSFQAEPSVAKVE